jgi:hypothetical protein
LYGSSSLGAPVARPRMLMVTGSAGSSVSFFLLKGSAAAGKR